MFTNDALTANTLSTPIIDWNRAESFYAGLGPRAIFARVLSLREHLPVARDLDRADDGTREGYYMDELSVANRELASRGFKAGRHFLQKA